jgi:hypothetical protein
MKAVLATFSAAALCALAGCSHVASSTSRYSNAPTLAPYGGWVQIMRVEPWRPYQALGEIVLDVTVMHPASQEMVDGKLRASAAELGADAVLVTLDRVRPASDAYDNSAATRRRDTDWTRKVVGVAIKYRE